MLHDATQKLIIKIAEMTRQQKLVWKETSNGVFRYETEGYQVHVTQNPIEILLTDLAGREIERLDNADLTETLNEEDESFAKIVAILRKEVARQVRGTDAAIATILAGLDFDGDSEPILSEKTEVENTVSDSEKAIASASEAPSNSIQEPMEEHPEEIVVQPASNVDISATTEQIIGQASESMEEMEISTREDTLSESTELMDESPDSTDDLEQFVGARASEAETSIDSDIGNIGIFGQMAPVAAISDIVSADDEHVKKTVASIAEAVKGGVAEESEPKPENTTPITQQDDEDTPNSHIIAAPESARPLENISNLRGEVAEITETLTNPLLHTGQNLVDSVTSNIFGNSVMHETSDPSPQGEEANETSLKKNYEQYNPWS